MASTTATPNKIIIRRKLKSKPSEEGPIPSEPQAQQQPSIPEPQSFPFPTHFYPAYIPMQNGQYPTPPPTLPRDTKAKSAYPSVLAAFPAGFPSPPVTEDDGTVSDSYVTRRSSRKKKIVVVHHNSDDEDGSDASDVEIVVKRKSKPKSNPKLSNPSSPKHSAKTPEPISRTQFEKDSQAIHILPAHRKICPSPLAKEAPEQSYRGIMNLSMLLLFITNLRMIVENYKKYGLLVSLPKGTYVPTVDYYWLASCYVMLAGATVFSFCVEKHASTVGKGWYCNVENSLRGWWKFNLGIIVVVPSLIVWHFIFHPNVGALVLFGSITLFLKLTSYHLVNAELRHHYYYESDYVTSYTVSYPNNITVSNLIHFIVAPTVSYQPSFPSLPRFRPLLALQYLFKTILTMSVMYIIIDQYATPTLQNSLKLTTDKTGAFKLDALVLVERILRLSISVVYLWLLMFYSLFHCWLNFLAEITCFGDREFYLPWWNCSTLAGYWRLWNQPIHTWLKRHIYIPLVTGKRLPDPRSFPEDPSPPKTAKRVSKFNAAITIFFISAVFHELLIGIPTKIPKLYAFGGMFLQIPLIMLTQYIDNWYRKYKPNGDNNIGNILFWFSFCIVGQPMAAFLYYREWNLREYGLPA